MSAPLFHHIGPYVIDRQIGVGGMAFVFLARDTRPGNRVVALKIVPEGDDEDARETIAAERRGAELQRQFLAGSEFVPDVYEVGHVPGYLYIAMEYVDGEDLSSIISRGPVESRRAVTIAIQLCRFLEAIDHLDAAVPGGASLTLLHNDLKPKNVRLRPGDRVKVLDFGAAKALSMSRRATRNEFYSTPYLSPECLESGERDRQADTWALGVMLYEMVTGRPPFTGDDTRRLEERIRSRRPPDPASGCPRALQAVIGKLLAPFPEDRYDGAAAIRGDLERLQAGQLTTAEQQGWPDRVRDEPPTRAVDRRANDEAPTRAVAGRSDDEPPTRRLDASGARAAGIAQADATDTVARRSAQSVRRWGWLRASLVVFLVGLAAHEGCVMAQASKVSAAVPLQDFKALSTSWSAYDSLRARSYLGIGSSRLGHALQRQTLVLAERVAANYRTPAPTVREAQWAAAEGALERALAVSPTDDRIRAMLRYAEGHLRRIDGEANKGRKQTAEAQRNFAEAVAAFREAAAARPNWPDPFLGLARTFIYGLEDIDRGADAINQAEKLGHKIGVRETTQLADGYRARGENLERAATTLGGMPQEREFLTRASEAYRTALDLYSKIGDVPEAAAQVKAAQRRLDAIARKVSDLDAHAPPSPTPVSPGSNPGSAVPAPAGRVNETVPSRSTLVFQRFLMEGRSL